MHWQHSTGQSVGGVPMRLGGWLTGSCAGHQERASNHTQHQLQPRPGKMAIENLKEGLGMAFAPSES